MNDSVPSRLSCQPPPQSAASPARDRDDAGPPAGTKWLAAENPFPFLCRPDRECSRKCCRGAILLTPYDVLRLKKRLGMQSGDFLREYVQICVDKQSPVPSLFLRPNAGGDADSWASRVVPFMPTVRGPAASIRSVLRSARILRAARASSAISSCRSKRVAQAPKRLSRRSTSGWIRRKPKLTNAGARNSRNSSSTSE